MITRDHLGKPADSDGGDAGGAEFDVFLSHNSLDKPVVERIAEQLRRDGLQPFLDVWDLTPGGRWQPGLADGLARSKTCALFVGPHSFGQWQLEELEGRAGPGQQARRLPRLSGAPPGRRGSV
jgi:hypothetical protein